MKSNKSDSDSGSSQADGDGQQQQEENNITTSSSNNITTSSSSMNGRDLFQQHVTGGNPSALDRPPQNVQDALLSSQIAGLLNSRATSAAATLPSQLPSIFNNSNSSSMLPSGNLLAPSLASTLNPYLLTQQQLPLMAQLQPQLQPMAQLTQQPQLQVNMNSILPGYGLPLAPPVSMLTGTSLPTSLSSATTQMAHQNLLAAQLSQQLQNSGSNVEALMAAMSSSPGIAPPLGELNNNNPLQVSDRAIAASAQAGSNTSSLAIPSDSTSLDPVHNFLRSQCIEVFVATKDDMTAPGRGARPMMIGQVGLRCRFCKNEHKKAKQAVCFPLKRETIFESVRNFQRTHMEVCTCIPVQVKAHYDDLIQQGGPRRKSQKYLKAYYAEAASELGIVDTLHGLMVGIPPNLSDVPRKELKALLNAEENPALSSSYWKGYSSGKDKSIEMRKFERVASDGTRRVILAARNEPTVIIGTEDFGSVSDYDYLLFHQVIPVAPQARFGLCCKYCVMRAGEGVAVMNASTHFPVDLNRLPDNGFFQKMLSHYMNCPNVPQEVKDAFDELKRLAWEHGTTPKRGSRKRLSEKVWERLKTYYGLKSDKEDK